MDKFLARLPPTEQGVLPAYLLIVGIVSIANSAQNFFTLHYTRRIYNGLFVRNPTLRLDPSAEDLVHKLIPASPAGKEVEKARDQMTPLAGRLFAVWTLVAGLVRIYTAYDTASPALYQLSALTHMVAAAHFTSELLVYKTLRLTGPQYFPLFAGWGGTVWMLSQYGHYVA